MADPAWRSDLPILDTEVDDYPLIERDNRKFIEDAFDREHTFSTGTYGSTTGKHLPGRCSIAFYGTTAQISALTNPPQYSFAYNTQTQLPYYFDGTAWQAYNLVTLGTNQTITGNKTFSGTIGLGGALTITGNMTTSGSVTHGQIPTLPGTNPTSDNQATRKAYVDTQVASNVAIPKTSNLLVIRPSAATVTITADHAILINASNQPLTVHSVSKTANIGNSGVNGLDSGSEAANTWYYIWLIAKSDGTVNSLLSTASTLGGLTLPSGYTYGLLVGAVRNSAASDFIAFRQIGDRCYFQDKYQVLANGAAVVWTSVNCSVRVPPIATEVHILGNVIGGGAVSGYAKIGFISSSTFLSLYRYQDVSYWVSTMMSSLMPIISQTIYYCNDNNQIHLTMDILGWKINL